MVTGGLDRRPVTTDQLWDWINDFTGVRLAKSAVCEGHQSQFEVFCDWWFRPQNTTLLMGSRGSGKSFLSALHTHLLSRFNPLYGTRILGGSLDQSRQIYEALRETVWFGEGDKGNDRGSIESLMVERAVYRNHSEIKILAASPTSVRGPHVPSLKLDEVDEIDPDLRDQAMGMAMARRGHKSTVVMTSTWHRMGGPMAGLMDDARAGKFPLHTFCVWEVLERCPEERSGPGLELCPECPLVPWCHSDRDRHPSGLPKAKRSDGHYAIDSLIQKTEIVSLRTFESDYLCFGPKADGIWFGAFDDAANVTVSAEYDPALDVHVSLDSGVVTGAVLFQVKDGRGGKRVSVFADFLTEGHSAEENARDVVMLCGSRCGGRRDRVSTDPNGASRNAIGPTVIAEYERAGLLPTRRREIERWPVGPVADSLATLEALVRSADGGVSLTIHPRCTSLIAAFKNYRRAKRSGQWQDYPQDPQHPAEDLIDALRGGIRVEMPEGRKPKSTLPRIPGRSVF